MQELGHLHAGVKVLGGYVLYALGRVARACWGFLIRFIIILPLRLLRLCFFRPCMHMRELPRPRQRRRGRLLSASHRYGSHGQAHTLPFSPLPIPPPSQCLSLNSPLSSSLHQPQSSAPSPPPAAPPSADWTLTLPLLVDPRGPLSLKKERRKDAEYKRLRQEQRRREDWTLGLDLAWSAGLLMGDARADGPSRCLAALAKRNKEGMLMVVVEKAAIGNRKMRATSSRIRRVLRRHFRFRRVEAGRSRLRWLTRMKMWRSTVVMIMAATKAGRWNGTCRLC